MNKPILTDAEEAVLELMIENGKLKDKIAELEKYIQELLWQREEYD